jgi:hypothetical protein
LDVLVVVPAQSIKNVKELDFRVNDRHPAKVLFEQKQEGQKSLPSDDNRMMLKESHETWQKACISGV